MQLAAWLRETLDGVLQANPILARVYRLKEWFFQFVGQHGDAALDTWFEEAAGSGLKPFQSVASSFRQDYAAIKLASTTPLSTGQCEDQICRLKLIKRLGYGRAKPDLLRQQVLYRLLA